MDKHQALSMLKLTQIFFFVNALFWLLLSVASLFLALNVSTILRWSYTLLMIANAAAMYWFGLKIINGGKRIFFLAILYVAVNVVLTITDQFGLVDALILLLNLCLLGLLFVTRQRLNRVESH